MMNLSKVNSAHPELRHGWHLCGPGPARFGWAFAHPCKLEWLARTKKEALVAAQEKGLIK